MDPLYTAANCKAAFELRWSLALFASAPIPRAETWITALKQVVEHDGVRILESHFREPNTHQFLLSSSSPDFSYNFLTLTSGCRDSAPTADISTTCIWCS